jgi:hypothetical protein
MTKYDDIAHFISLRELVEIVAEDHSLFKRHENQV